MRNNSVKWGHLENLDLELNKHNFPYLWGHLTHFVLGFTFHNYYNLNCELVP